MATMPTKYNVEVNSPPVTEKCQDEYHNFRGVEGAWMLFCTACGMTLKLVVDASGS